MDRFIEIDGESLKNYVLDYNVICCKLRNSRVKSKQLGIMEFLMSMYDLDVLFIKNGPLGDIKGLVSFFIKKQNWDKAVSRLSYIGYFDEFYELDFDITTPINKTNLKTINPLVWKGLKFSLKNLYIQSQELYETQSPHNRPFKIVSQDGNEKEIIGYRGDGSELGRRALPVEDARCLVNLSMPFQEKKVIEPFAGGGGIVYMYKYINPNIDITSIDIDSTLKPGLEYYGSKHIVGDASEVHLTDSYDAIVTEVPFSQNATEKIVKAMKNIYPNLSDKGIIVLMCGEKQSEQIIKYFANELNSNMIFSKKLNRKGTDVVIQIWTKNFELQKELNQTVEVVSRTF